LRPRAGCGSINHKAGEMISGQVVLNTQLEKSVGKDGGISINRDKI